jgi:fatty acid desaturase
MVGMMFAVAYSVWDNKRYVQVQDKHGGFAPPEARLPPTLIASIAIPIGLFWFAWTNYPSIHWIVCILAGAPFWFTTYMYQDLGEFFFVSNLFLLTRG